MIIWGLIILLVALIVWLLFTPLILRLDTDRSIYELRLVGLIRVCFSLDYDYGVVLHFFIPLHHFKLYPLRSSGEPKRSKEKKGSKSSNMEMKKILRVIRSFKVSVFRLEVDTDDYVLNAYLVPVSYYLQHHGLQTSVNFDGESYLKLELKNSVWGIGRAFFGF